VLSKGETDKPKGRLGGQLSSAKTRTNGKMEAKKGGCKGGGAWDSSQKESTKRKASKGPANQKGREGKRRSRALRE